MKERTCCFTGHREILDDMAYIREHLNDEIENLIKMGITQFITGGARGFDTIAAKSVLSLKKKYPYITFLLVIPCEGQENGWSAQEKEEYHLIRAKADRVVVLAEHYYKGCMQERNRYMVDQSSVCLAYLRKDSGGTAYTVQYAKNKQLQVIHIITK